MPFFILYICMSLKRKSYFYNSLIKVFFFNKMLKFDEGLGFKILVFKSPLIVSP